MGSLRDGVVNAHGNSGRGAEQCSEALTRATPRYRRPAGHGPDDRLGASLPDDDPAGRDRLPHAGSCAVPN